ncbi:hypothetical protein Lesp02_58910 [Lentzea sp. NBRC 105346]|uniref:ClpX C4-type zinc finger protein n=1 Tax=Lentzea sp. NBRC 105346 TaxID=3032205 RepID=UPI0024A332CF|nr:ClpX C4-type zinc finger protein [Lentzea sp. NBRC 105346]GLZ33703.1 hypothetical protein Lesp02_58910 [Lentzea sp. NBRC 105346]
MTLDDELLRQARAASTKWSAAQDTAELAKADYHHAVRRLHAAGGSLREIAEALSLSHQRVHQIVAARRESGPSCSFCFAGQNHVAKLVAGPSELICDTCVGKAQANATGDCSFCGENGPVFQREDARICDGCVRLAAEVVAAAAL